MRANIKKILIKSNLMGCFRFFHQNGIRTLRSLRRIDSSLVESYMSKNTCLKLHIGCGDNILDGWLNSNLFPSSNKILHLDATKSFPFPNQSFDYIFSEHVIEHMPYSNGLIMLNEAYRILKNNGKIRITTPNLQFLIDLYKENKSDLQLKYIEWSAINSTTRIPYASDTFVINNFVRDWGHMFIYDEKTLRASLQSAGFKDIVRCNLNESRNKTFRHLENYKRMPDDFLKLESFTLEATKYCS